MKHSCQMIPVKEASELFRLRRPRRISRAFWLLPVLGVGGREASMKGIESSSKRGDFDLEIAEVISIRLLSDSHVVIFHGRNIGN